MIRMRARNVHAEHDRSPVAEQAEKKANGHIKVARSMPCLHNETIFCRDKPCLCLNPIKP